MARETHRWVIDSIAEHVAAIEVDGGPVVRLPEWVLPRGAREGDVLAVHHELDAAGRRSTLAITIDDAATRSTLRGSAHQVEAIRKASRRRDPGGDVSL
ncbi:MAG: DUF3006 domain-containing protein [Gemmatimonadota bacterium]|nr:DUF3006 domain-containing protein [Gemmatimonadota bacterium]HEU4988238.1 DUF3006 domain-containing protein [Gemmatimonadaceae bacterium]